VEIVNKVVLSVIVKIFFKNIAKNTEKVRKLP
jgi:hypothetical protein